MLHALASARDQRPIWWLHTTRGRETHAFASEVTRLVQSLPHARQYIYYTTGGSDDGGGDGLLDQKSIGGLNLPTDATVYLCGPGAFMDDMREALAAIGVDATHIHTELFGALPPINPGVVVTSAPPRPHLPVGAPGTGPAVTFARSGLSVNWSSRYRSLLELAQACDVQTRFSCRSGVCHTCETGIVTGDVAYIQPPLEMPPQATVLICCAAPDDDLVLDL